MFAARRPPLLASLAALFATAHALALQPARALDPAAAPEQATGSRHLQLESAKSFMIAAANGAAVDAGLEMLRAGGNAADAAVAVQLVLNLVEPQSSGLGGGAFILHWDASSQTLESYDGRETAPAAASPDRFLVDGRPRPFEQAVFGGLSVGVPGALRALEALHRRHGRLPWAHLFEPAIKLATEGFRVSPRLHLLLGWHGADGFSAAARAYFFDTTGNAWPVNYLLKNPQFAASLRAIAEGGSDAFYKGAIAEAIVAAVRGAPNHQGDISLADLAGYSARERAPLCIAYRRYKVCGMGPPSSGGLAVAQVLKLIEPFDLGNGPASAMNARALHLIAEAEKLAFADRDAFVGDPDFVPAPAGLLNTGYLDARRGLIDPTTAMARPTPGAPPQTATHNVGDDATIEAPGTSHFSIVDRDGNVLAMTTSIESAFGSRIWAAGLLLNNELTDFAFRPVDGRGRPLANALAAGKRPRSSMAPTIVFDATGKPWAALGSPGGNRIILYVVKALVALIDWQLDAQAATALMNFGSRGGPFEIEIDQPSAIWHALKMKPYGHRVSADLLTSGTHAILVRQDGTLEGGADPRREGVARGD
ncbi:MAG TPA: gamma-glutamyltransferase [Hyphomicrobiaceae bacterium]|nr:gamma-glutamyltransferase [Hyphomicrobiaceae bacterium]